LRGDAKGLPAQFGGDGDVLIGVVEKEDVVWACTDGGFEDSEGAGIGLGEADPVRSDVMIEARDVREVGAEHGLEMRFVSVGEAGCGDSQFLEARDDSLRAGIGLDEDRAMEGLGLSRSDQEALGEILEVTVEVPCAGLELQQAGPIADGAVCFFEGVRRDAGAMTGFRPGSADADEDAAEIEADHEGLGSHRLPI